MKKLVIILVLLLAAAAYAYYLYQKPVSDIRNLEPDYTITARELFDQFDIDEMKANDKYLGKIVEVSGTIRDKKSDQQGLTFILATDDPIFGINCGLDEKEQERFDTYKTGDPVVLRGSCSGKTMDVVLTRCVIIR